MKSQGAKVCQIISIHFLTFFSTLLDLVRRGTAQFSRTHPSFFVVGVGGMLANIFQDEQCNWLYEGPFSNRIWGVGLPSNRCDETRVFKSSAILESCKATPNVPYFLQIYLIALECLFKLKL